MHRSSPIFDATERICHLLAEICRPSDPAYDSLVSGLTDSFVRLAATRSYFPLSLLREHGRLFLAGSELPDNSRLVFLRAEADAILQAMVASPIGGLPSQGKAMRHVVAVADRQDEPLGLFLRLRHIAGLQTEEFPSEALRAGAEELANRLEPLTIPVQRIVDAQNLQPRGEITALLERVRDGRRSMLEALALHADRFRPIARKLLSLEGRGISVSADDLVHDAIIRMADRDAPLNRVMLNDLAHLVMRNILTDRSRRKVPGGGKLKGELTDLRVAAHALPRRVSFDELPLGTLLRDEFLSVVGEAIAKVAALRSKPFHGEIVRARWFDGLALKDLARLHGISQRSVQRILDVADDIVRERFEAQGAWRWEPNRPVTPAQPGAAAQTSAYSSKGAPLHA